MDEIITRVLNQIGDNELLEKLLLLSKSDLNSLLLKLYQEQGKTVTPVDLLKSFHKNRFTVPSDICPINYHKLEFELLSLAQQKSIETVLLSPSAPFGSCCAFGYVDQNKIISAVRGTEALPDPSNMLAIIIADKLKNKEIDNNEGLHYCTTVRVVRAQTFPAKKGYYSHFGIFSIVSSGKDSGSYTCELSLLLKQIDYYKQLVIDKYNANLSIIIKKRDGYKDADGFISKIASLLSNKLPDVPFAIENDTVDNQYYIGMNYKIIMEKDDTKIEIGDGGFVDWIQRMTSNNKERCLISGIGIDRLLI